MIQKKNFNIQILTLLDFLKKPIIIQIGKLILVILVTPMMFLRQFWTEQEGDNIKIWPNDPIKPISQEINVHWGEWLNM